MPYNPTDEELEMLPYRRWPEHVRRRIDAEACKTVDEKSAKALMEDPDAIYDRTFILPGEGPEDTVTFRAIGNTNSYRNSSWDVFYDDSFDSVTVDNAKLNELLIGSIAYKDW